MSWSQRREGPQKNQNHGATIVSIFQEEQGTGQMDAISHTHG